MRFNIAVKLILQERLVQFEFNLCAWFDFCANWMCFFHLCFYLLLQLSTWNLEIYYI